VQNANNKTQWNSNINRFISLHIRGEMLAIFTVVNVKGRASNQSQCILMQIHHLLGRS